MRRSSPAVASCANRSRVSLEGVSSLHGSDLTIVPGGASLSAQFEQYVVGLRYALSTRVVHRPSGGGSPIPLREGEQSNQMVPSSALSKACFEGIICCRRYSLTLPSTRLLA